MFGLNEFEIWLADFILWDEEDCTKEETYVIESIHSVFQSNTQKRKKEKHLVKKEKKDSIATKSSMNPDKSYYDSWRLNDCNVCRRCVGKTIEGAAIHKAIHKRHTFRCKQLSSCGSIYDTARNLKVHQDLNPGH